jgi:hypothetical protein
MSGCRLLAHDESGGTTQPWITEDEDKTKIATVTCADCKGQRVATPLGSLEVIFVTRKDGEMYDIRVTEGFNDLLHKRARGQSWKDLQGLHKDNSKIGRDDREELEKDLYLDAWLNTIQCAIRYVKRYNPDLSKFRNYVSSTLAKEWLWDRGDEDLYNHQELFYGTVADRENRLESSAHNEENLSDSPSWSGCKLDYHSQKFKAAHDVRSPEPEMDDLLPEVNRVDDPLSDLSLAKWKRWEHPRIATEPIGTAGKVVVDGKTFTVKSYPMGNGTNRLADAKPLRNRCSFENSTKTNNLYVDILASGRGLGETLSPPVEVPPVKPGELEAAIEALRAGDREIAQMIVEGQSVEEIHRLLPKRTVHWLKTRVPHIKKELARFLQSKQDH